MRGPARALVRSCGWELARPRGPLPNAAPHTFRLPGRNVAKERDWVLVLDAAPAAR
jgi:hypothetical protein